MSMASSLLLLLLLLFMVALCDARHLRPDKEDRSKRRFTTSSIKIAENVRSRENDTNINIPKRKPSPNENKTTMAHNVKTTPFDVKTKELDGSEEAVKKLVTVSKRKRPVQHSKDHSSLVSVSWRLPRKKPAEKHPGFNSDYPSPKTHPPSHN